MKAFSIMLSDIGRCPKGSLSPRHYFPDGSCKCGQVPAMKKQLLKLQERRRVFLAQVDSEMRRLKDEIES